MAPKGGRGRGGRRGQGDDDAGGNRRGRGGQNDQGGGRRSRRDSGTAGGSSGPGGRGPFAHGESYNNARGSDSGGSGGSGGTPRPGRGGGGVPSASDPSRTRPEIPPENNLPDIPSRPPARVPEIADEKLRDFVKRYIYKGAEFPDDMRVGDGTTMDSLRNELITGRMTNNRFHLIKADEAISYLERWPEKNPHGSAADRAVAANLAAELKKAIWGQR